MRHLLFPVLACLMLLCGPATAGPVEGPETSGCRWYNDNYYHYSICAPRDWKKSYQEDGDRHYLSLRRGHAGAEISVAALPADGGEKQDGIDWRKWVSRVAGKGFRKIIVTKDLAAGDNVTVKIVVFDYYSRGARMLQRSLFARYGSSSLVIECKAPIRSFSKYTDVFNEVMSSVDYTGTVTGDAMNEPGEDNAAARKPAVPKKPEKPKKIAEQKKNAEPLELAEPKKKAGPKKPPVAVKRKEPARDAAPSKPQDETDMSLQKTGKEKKTAAAEKAKEVKNDTSAEKTEDASSGEVKGKGEDEYTDVEKVEDPEARKAIESELNTLQDMERKGLIEKVEEDK